MEKVLEHVSENLSVETLPDDKFVIPYDNDEDGKGFGVAGGTIRSHKLEHTKELIEGKHFITGVGKPTHLENSQLRYIGLNVALSVSGSLSRANGR